MVNSLLRNMKAIQLINGRDTCGSFVPHSVNKDDPLRKETKFSAKHELIVMMFTNVFKKLAYLYSFKELSKSLATAGKIMHESSMGKLN